MFRLYCALIGYALGCLQFAYFAGKLNRIDIREHGSGNAGMTNVARVMGAKFGVFVFFADMAKAALAFLIAARLFGGDVWGGNITPGMYAGLGAALGHNFPFHMGFKGGKGVSCTLAAAIMSSPPALAVIAAVCVPLLLWKRYISLISLTGSAMLPMFLYVFGAGAESSAVAFVMSTIIWWRHRGNLKRLLKGEERKLWQKKGG
jgi:glycerol-3-phosphate acyltransferase PlsY